LRNWHNIKRLNDPIRLDELLAANRNLLKDGLKHLWDDHYLKAAKRFWADWYRRAMQSGTEHLRRFARRLRPCVAGILAHCCYRPHTSLLEGINNTIKVIERMAYGFRDEGYFFLKIRPPFPEFSDEPDLCWEFQWIISGMSRK